MKILGKLSLAALLLAGGTYGYADEEGEERHGHAVGVVKSMNQQDIASAALYQKECGACHMAYQPEFLPQRSWAKMMNTLENHFGTDASLDPQDQKTIQNVLMTHASKNDRIRDRKGGITLRISQTPHFLREHREIPKKMVVQPEVKSFSNCTACHTKAASGSYREREIHIPNYGHWE